MVPGGLKGSLEYIFHIKIFKNHEIMQEKDIVSYYFFAWTLAYGTKLRATLPEQKMLLKSPNYNPHSSRVNILTFIVSLLTGNFARTRCTLYLLISFRLLVEVSWKFQTRLDSFHIILEKLNFELYMSCYFIFYFVSFAIG